MSNPVPPKPNDKLIDASNAFGKGTDRPQPIPTFSIEDLAAMGARYVETEETKLFELPFSAQRQLVDVLRRYGFGVGHALDELLKRILELYGFDGRVQTKTSEKFDWIAFQSKKEGAAQPLDAAEPIQDTTAPVGSELIGPRDLFAQAALTGLIIAGMKDGKLTIDAENVWDTADAIMAARNVKVVQQ